MRFNAVDCCFIVKPFGQSLFLHIFSFFTRHRYYTSLLPHALICTKISACKLRYQFSDRLLIVAERLIAGEITIKGAAEVPGMYYMRQALASFKGLPYIIVLYGRSN